MVHWLMIILVYDLTILKLSFGEVTLALRLLHYKNRHGMTYENHSCDTRIEHDLNRDGRCDTAFLFCLVRLPFQNPHNCTLGDYFTGVVGADDIHFINMDEQSKIDVQQRSSALVSLWFQPTVYFRFKYPKTGIGMIVEVYDVDDPNNHTVHDSIDFYGRTLLDLKISPSKDTAQKQRIYLRSLFGSYTNLTVDLSLYCSVNYYGKDCETFCQANEQRYDCDLNTGQKICKHGYFGSECLDDVRVCDDHSCLNNGTCVVYLGGYLCRCQKGFTGRSCEISNERILKCNQLNCIHGNCSNEGKCICHEGWTSDQCNQRAAGCASQPCFNNATCEVIVGINPEYTYRCHCRIGYSGRNCEIEMSKSCERIACFHGHCLQTSVYNEFCVCHENWTGNDCSQRIHFPPVKPMKSEGDDYLTWLNVNYGMTKAPPRFILPTTTFIHPEYKYTSCLSSPCLHNSTCIARSEQTFQCICSPSFIGLYCEIEHNPCDNSPCQHQSICLPQPNQTFRCICRAHYTGKFCEYPVPFNLPTMFKKCSRNCQNGGICLIDESNKEQCICKSSYAGLYCELTKKICLNNSDPLCHDDPCLSHPCLSNGTCHSLISTKNYTCSCSIDYTGKRCETTIQFHRTIANLNPKMDLWPLAIVFGYVFSLALVFIIIWFIWYGLTIRPQTSLTYGENVNDRYQLNRLSVSNPIFYTNQEYHTPIAKTWSTSPTTISNLDQWTRTITH